MKITDREKFLEESISVLAQIHDQLCSLSPQNRNFGIGCRKTHVLTSS